MFSLKIHNLKYKLLSFCYNFSMKSLKISISSDFFNIICYAAQEKPLFFKILQI